MTLLLLSFLAWILTIMAPCVLPILPIVLAWSVGEKSYKRPLLITLSLAVSIVFFTVLLKATTVFISIPHIFWLYFSWSILILLWLVYVFPDIWWKLASTCKLSYFQGLLQKSQNVHSFSLQAVLTGFALWPVFSSCSPTYAFLLATVFPASFLQGILYTLSYALGLASMLFLIAWGGQTIVKKLKFFADEKGLFRKFLWLIFILFGLAIITWVDKKIEVFILSTCNIGTIEQTLFDVFRP